VSWHTDRVSFLCNSGGHPTDVGGASFIRLNPRRLRGCKCKGDKLPLCMWKSSSLVSNYCCCVEWTAFSMRTQWTSTVGRDHVKSFAVTTAITYALLPLCPGRIVISVCQGFDASLATATDH